MFNLQHKFFFNSFQCQFLIVEDCKTQNKKNVVIKSVHYFRLYNKQDILFRFQNRTSFFRSLLNEIKDFTTLTLISKHFDDDILHVFNTHCFTRLEVKYVVKRVLETLIILHEKRFVHINIYVNFNFKISFLIKIYYRHQTQQCINEL